MGKPDSDYEVGYGKPPKATQFKPGQSGNPNGRPKGAKGVKTVFREALSERVPVTRNGHRQTMSKLEVIVQSMVNEAAKGNSKVAIRLLDQVMKVMGVGDEEPGAGAAPLLADDQAILAAYVAKAGLVTGKRPEDGTRADNGQPPGEDTPVQDDALDAEADAGTRVGANAAGAEDEADAEPDIVTTDAAPEAPDAGAGADAEVADAEEGS